MQFTVICWLGPETELRSSLTQTDTCVDSRGHAHCIRIRPVNRRNGGRFLSWCSRYVDGSVALVPPERVQQTELSFKEAIGIFERLGRDTRRLFDT